MGVTGVPAPEGSFEPVVVLFEIGGGVGPAADSVGHAVSRQRAVVGFGEAVPLQQQHGHEAEEGPAGGQARDGQFQGAVLELILQCDAS